MGREITLANLVRKFFWPQQYKIVRKFVKNYDFCAKSKVWCQSTQKLLQPLLVPGRFHSELATDFMTDFHSQAPMKKFKWQSMIVC